TEGVAEVNGRVASLITVGAGFQQELTGRENMYVGGAVLGMTRREVDAAAPAILEFSGLGDAINRPVKHYSSGMFMRLAFAVGIYAQPEILLIDEVIAVGDAAFRVRCKERVLEMLDRGVTLVFVSHSPEMISRLCPRSIVLSAGEVVFDGVTNDALERYFALIDTPIEAPETQFEVDASVQRVAGGATLEAFELSDATGTVGNVFTGGSAVTVNATMRFDREVPDPAVRLLLVSGPQQIAHIRVGDAEGTFGPGDRLDVSVPMRLALGPGVYQFVITVRGKEENTLALRQRSEPVHVRSRPGSLTKGYVDLEAEPELRSGPRVRTTKEA
ncbi:MAG: Wzt carbohydrate-binding domain-containing protein, partial [Actinobacteria bacterium]|nr:Wzt carbohydrate-binding domain-containing protein [Actinomycetota bacterium]